MLHRLPGGVFTFVLLLIPSSPACQVPGQLADPLYVADLSLSGSCPLGCPALEYTQPPVAAYSYTLFPRLPSIRVLPS